MAVLIDTSILIAYERGQLDIAARVAGREAEEAFLSVISASELLHGAHRATDPAVHARRLAFVEATLARFPVLEIDLEVARARRPVELPGATGRDYRRARLLDCGDLYRARSDPHRRQYP